MYYNVHKRVTGKPWGTCFLLISEIGGPGTRTQTIDSVRATHHINPIDVEGTQLTHFWITCSPYFLYQPISKVLSKQTSVVRTRSYLYDFT